MALINELTHKKQKPSKCLYLAPMKSLCREKYNEWRQKFKEKAHLYELTGDTEEEQTDSFQKANIIIATPEKLDSLSRNHLNILKNIDLLLIDEIHMLNIEERGATLEAIVSRLMSIQLENMRILAVSATNSNIGEVAQWLRVPKNGVFVFG